MQTNKAEAKANSVRVKSPFQRLVVRLRWINPWLIVGWRYCEQDDFGIRVLRKQGTTYLWRCMVTAGVLWVANFLIDATGMPQNKSDFFIVSAT